MDGLGLDATFAIYDQSPTHLLAELSATVRRSLAGDDAGYYQDYQGSLAEVVLPKHTAVLFALDRGAAD